MMLSQNRPSYNTNIMKKMCLCKPCKTFLNMVNWKQQIAQRGFYMKRICIVFVVLLLFPYFNMFVWTPSEPDAMSSQASALSTESSSASASPYYLAAIGADDTAAVLDGYPVKETVIAVIDTGAERTMWMTTAMATSTIFTAWILSTMFPLRPRIIHPPRFVMKPRKMIPTPAMARTSAGLLV